MKWINRWAFMVALAASLYAIPVQAQIAFVDTVNSGGLQNGVSAATTGSQNLVTGNLLVCYIRWAASGVSISSVADTAGNTYTNGTLNDLVGTDRGQATWVFNATGNAANQTTITLSGSVNSAAALCDQFSGIATTNAFDVQALGCGATACADSPVTSGTFTTTQADELIWTGMNAASTSSSWTAGTGFTITNSAAGANGVALGSQRKIVSSVQTNVTADATHGAGLVNGEITVATFKAAAGAGVARRRILP